MCDLQTASIWMWKRIAFYLTSNYGRYYKKLWHIYFWVMFSASGKSISCLTTFVLKALFLSNRFTRTQASRDFALNKRRRSPSIKHITESNSTMQIIAWRDSQRRIKVAFEGMSLVPYRYSPGEITFPFLNMRRKIHQL